MPCLVLKFRDISVMLDCALDMSSLQYFLPVKQVTRYFIGNSIFSSI